MPQYFELGKKERKKECERQFHLARKGAVQETKTCLCCSERVFERVSKRVSTFVPSHLQDTSSDVDGTDRRTDGHLPVPIPVLTAQCILCSVRRKVATLLHFFVRSFEKKSVVFFFLERLISALHGDTLSTRLFFSTTFFCDLSVKKEREERSLDFFENEL